VGDEGQSKELKNRKKKKKRDTIVANSFPQKHQKEQTKSLEIRNASGEPRILLGRGFVWGEKSESDKKKTG